MSQLSFKQCFRETLDGQSGYVTSHLFKSITRLTSPHLEALVQGREDMYLPQPKVSPLEKHKKREQETNNKNMSQIFQSCGKSLYYSLTYKVS